MLLDVLYRQAIKPALFCRDPEAVHDAAIKLGVRLGGNKLTRSLTRVFYNYQHPALTQNLFGLDFKNPVGLSAGFDKDGHLLPILLSLGFGFTQVGTVTAKPYGGNPSPRATRLPERDSILVNYGLKNDGTDIILPRVAQSYPAAIPVSISVGRSNLPETADHDAGLADFQAGIQAVIDANCADLLTLNISCPNTCGGEPYTEPSRLRELLAEMPTTSLPVLIKLPIDIADRELERLIDVAAEYNVSGLIIGNLRKDRRMYPDRVANSPGALSGAPTRDLSTNRITHAYRYTDGTLPIIGVGGIMSAEHAYDKIRAGASLLQLITGLIYRGPGLTRSINRGLVGLLHRDGFTHLSQAIGLNS